MARAMITKLPDIQAQLEKEQIAKSLQAMAHNEAYLQESDQWDQGFNEALPEEPDEWWKGRRLAK